MEKQEEAKAKQPRETMLSLYAHVKQGKYGEAGFNAEPQPGFFDFAAKMKYKAWQEIHTMDQNEAKQKFISIAKSVFGELPSK